MQLCTIMGCLSLTGRFAEFMDLRVQKQQLLNKDLRRVAVRMLDSQQFRNIEEDEETVSTPCSSTVLTHTPPPPPSRTPRPIRNQHKPKPEPNPTQPNPNPTPSGTPHPR